MSVRHYPTSHWQQAEVAPGPGVTRKIRQKVLQVWRRFSRYYAVFHHQHTQLGNNQSYLYLRDPVDHS